MEYFRNRAAVGDDALKIGIVLLVVGFVLLAGSSQIAAVLSINPNSNLMITVSPTAFAVQNNKSYSFNVTLTPLVDYAMNLEFRATNLLIGATVSFVCPGILAPRILVVDARNDGWAPRTVAGTIAVGELAKGTYRVGIEANVDMGEYFSIGSITITQPTDIVPPPTTTTSPTPTTTPTPTPPLTQTTWFSKQNLMMAGGILVLLGLIMVAMKR